MTDLERCEQALLKAEAAYDKVEHARGDERRKAIYEATERIDADLSVKYGDEMNRLREAKIFAKIAYENAAFAHAHANLPYPVGTKMIGWKSPMNRYSSIRRPHEPVAIGIIEVFGPDSETPDNVRYGIPSIGDIVVRVLKKDGTPSKVVENLGRYSKHIWLPEGEKPKDS